MSAATGYSANLTFTPPIAASCTLNVTVSPASLATDGTWVELRQQLTAGPSGTLQNFIVRSLTMASFGTQQDTVAFTGLAPNIIGYGVTSQRSLSGATPTPMVSAAPVAVTAAASPVTCLLAYTTP